MVSKKDPDGLIGRRCLCIQDYMRTQQTSIKGLMGTAVAYRKGLSSISILVEFDAPIPEGHNGSHGVYDYGSYGIDGRCWYIPITHLKLFDIVQTKIEVD